MNNLPLERTARTLRSSSARCSVGDIGGGDDVAVLPVTLDIGKGVGDDVGAGLDDMAKTRLKSSEDPSAVLTVQCSACASESDHVSSESDTVILRAAALSFPELLTSGC